MLSWRGPGHPHYGGAEINTLENVTAWAKAGHNVVWFTSIFPGGKKQETVNGVKIVRRGSQNFEVHLLAFWWYVFEDRPKFDVVIDQFHGIPFFTPLYVRVPKLAFIHEATREVWWLNPWPKPLNLIPAILGTIIEPLIFLLYHQIQFMTVSNSTKEDLIRYKIPSKNIHVFLSGVILHIPSPLPKKELRPTLMYLGALSKDKGVEDALGVFSTIHKSHPNWQFWIVGKGSNDYQQLLLGLCRSLKITNKVKFWGFVSVTQKFILLARAHLLINPSVREGWGLVNIEANSVSTPVVGYNVPGTKDSVQHGQTGILSPLGQVDLLATNAIDLMEDKKRYAKIAARGKKWSEQFSWDKFTKQSLSLLKRVAYQHKSH